MWSVSAMYRTLVRAISCEVASRHIPSLRVHLRGNQCSLWPAVYWGERFARTSCGLAALSWQGVCLASLTIMMQKKKNQYQNLSLSFDDDDDVTFGKFGILLLILILSLLKITKRNFQPYHHLSLCIYVCNSEVFFLFIT